MTTGVASAAPAAAARAAPEHWPLRSRARAKVNLYLHVVGRRVDGYHLLDTLAVFPEVGDLVLAGPAGLDPDGAGSLDDSARGASVFGEAAGGEVLALELAGPQAGSLVAEADNLVLRAARALARDAGIAARARLRLEKHLPVASGIGGGSADAAAALRVLGRLWSVPEALRPGGAALSALALRLGADVPVCIEERPARMGGIGEELTPAPALPVFGMALVNPGVPVATPSVFRARTGGFSPPALLPEGWADAVAMAADLAGLRNDLEAPAIGLCPAIADVLAALRARPGCLLARMSGSGATCFGLFADAAGAEHAAAALARPGWWCWGGRVGRHP